MTPRLRNSLGRKLTRRMISLQLLSLGVFFGLGVFPLVLYPTLSQFGAVQTPDPSVAGIVADALVGVDGERIKIETGGELGKLLDEYPEMFVYVQSADGASATIGTLTASARFALFDLDAITTLDVIGGPRAGGSFLVRRAQSDIGQVAMVIGNGPLVGIASLLRTVAIALAVSTWVVLTLVCLFAIPLVVRRELRGVQHIAADASRIDFDSRGERLREDGVPGEIQALVSAVNGALDRLDQSYAGRQRFLAAAAHEVRTPIAILQLRLEQSPPFPERQRLLLDVARLGGLAEQLLELQRIENVPPRREPVDLQELAERVVGDLAPLAIAAGYDIAVVPACHRTDVLGDAQSLYGALANLVQNAITYGGGGGEILVEIGRDLSVSVADAGPGIPEAERGRIFEPFQRLRRGAGGTGLGLHLVQAIMSLHGGTVSVAESASGGALFTLHFPQPAHPAV